LKLPSALLGIAGSGIAPDPCVLRWGWFELIRPAKGDELIITSIGLEVNRLELPPRGLNAALGLPELASDAEFRGRCGFINPSRHRGAGLRLYGEKNEINSFTGVVGTQ